jgi:hypothetical protein
MTGLFKEEWVMYGTTYDGGGFGAVTWLIILAVYLYFAYAQFKIAQKTGHSGNAWWSFIPILNIFLLVQMANKPWYWFLFCLVPFINIIILAVLWIDVAKACSQSPVWGFLTILPFINFISIGVLAFSGTQHPSQFPPTKPAPRQPERVG